MISKKAPMRTYGSFWNRFSDLLGKTKVSICRVSRELVRAAPLLLLVGAATANCAQNDPSLAISEKPSLSEEYLLLGDPNRGAGEPWVAVNPRDLNNIVVTAMATLNRLPSGEGPARGDSLRIKELSTPDGSVTDIAVTHDGGKTWSFGTDDFRKTFNTNRCSDSFAGAGADGSLYIGCLAYLARGSVDFNRGCVLGGEPYVASGGSAIARSVDGGRTWGRPIWVHPTHSPQLYPPTVHPVFIDVSPVDRPLFAADAQTGTIFLTGMGAVYSVDPGTFPAPAKGHPQWPPKSVTGWSVFIRASHDQGRTWGLISPSSSPGYPQAGLGFGLSASYGNLIVAYDASSAPGKHCPPCVVFGRSRDDGKTFNYQVLPYSPDPATPPETPVLSLSGVLVAADPSTAGRFAIAFRSGQKLVVAVTEDAGNDWLPLTTVAELPSDVRFGHRAMKFSPSGTLAVMWKNIYPDESFDTWSAASLDHGKTFHTVRVSHARSPVAPADRNNFMLGDDLSSIDVDGKYVYVVWGDNRAGFEGTWFGRVPLSAY